MNDHVLSKQIVLNALDQALRDEVARRFNFYSVGSRTGGDFDKLKTALINAAVDYEMAINAVRNWQ